MITGARALRCDDKYGDALCERPGESIRSGEGGPGRT